MNPNETTPNPLDSLRDIHTPEMIDHFQLAPGWWFLIALALLLISYFVLRILKQRRALRLLVPANNELNQIALKTPNNFAMAELSALLKRICLIYYPQNQVAALSGEQWTLFLNNQVGKELFNQTHQNSFSQLAYQADQQIPANLWLEIIDNSRIAINSIIKQAAKKQLKQKGSN